MRVKCFFAAYSLEIIPIKAQFYNCPARRAGKVQNLYLNFYSVIKASVLYFFRSFNDKTLIKLFLKLFGKFCVQSSKDVQMSQSFFPISV